MTHKLFERFSFCKRYVLETSMHYTPAKLQGHGTYKWWRMKHGYLHWNLVEFFFFQKKMKMAIVQKIDLSIFIL